MVVIVTVLNAEKRKRKFIVAEANNRINNISDFNDKIIEHYIELASDDCEFKFSSIVFSVLTKKGMAEAFCNIDKDGYIEKYISNTTYRPFSVLMQIGCDDYLIDDKNKENVFKEVIVSPMADCVEFITYKDGKPFKKTVESLLGD